MTKIQVTMTQAKETKNTWKFAAEAPSVGKPPVSEVYIQKSHFNGQPVPRQILVTVEGQ